MDKKVKKSVYDARRNQRISCLSHVAKTAFLRQRLHDFLALATKIDEIEGEKLDWNFGLLGISAQAWNKVIHQGIKPVIIFAHPVVLKTVPGSVSYYRMVSMMSQKSMEWTRLKADGYELDQAPPDEKRAFAISKHLNRMMSCLVEVDEKIDALEFDLWRGMAAGLRVGAQ